MQLRQFDSEMYSFKVINKLTFFNIPAALPTLMQFKLEDAHNTTNSIQIKCRKTHFLTNVEYSSESYSAFLYNYLFTPNLRHILTYKYK